MPQRFLRPGITNSERWNSVSFEAQSAYIRLLTIVDDYGRCDGRAPVLHGACFSMWNAMNPEEQITLGDLCSILEQLAAVELIDRYNAEGKDVIQFLQWGEKPREGTKSKWPCNPVAASCGKLQEVAASLDPRSSILDPRSSPYDQVDFDQFWSAYPRKVGKPHAKRAFGTAIQKTSLENMLKALEYWKTQWTDPKYTPHPTTWLNREGWNDERVKPAQKQQSLPLTGDAIAKAARGF